VRRCNWVLNVGSTLPTRFYTGEVSSIPAGDDVLDPDEPTYDLSRVAELLGVPVTRVHQQLREGHLLAVRRGDGVVVPQVFFTNSGQVVKSLPGLLTILHDGGYHETEIARWLFTPDPSLTVTRDGTRDAINNARPVDALHAHQAREVVRRAQALAY
jgi:Rv2175c C-terminal domain of unknown function